MYSTVNTAILHGIESIPVQVEADVSDGMPLFEMVGFLSTEVKEAKERVRAALRNCGYRLPVKRITINISPAEIRKSGSGFDLPVAIAVLMAMGVIENQDIREMVIFGELGLYGQILPVKGALSIVLAAKEANITRALVPFENMEEASMVPDMDVLGAKNLPDVISYLKKETKLYQKKEKPLICEEKTEWENYDFSQVNGQKLLKRACEIAVAGKHDILMIGPPGAGKTMVAKCIPSILLPLTEKEKLEISKIYSACGLFQKNQALIENRPFRNPHHTITKAGLTGGGSIPHPGEISLAHGGVLFLDELTEFQKETLEILRQPMEEKVVRLVRNNGSFTFPADFLGVFAMNPCPCGNFPDFSKCHCSDKRIHQYLEKISQPLLDRIDLTVEVPRVSYQDLTGEKKNESSKQIRQRIIVATEIQKERFAEEIFQYNSQIPAGKLERYCPLNKKEKRFMEEMYKKMNLTARTYHKIIKVARTIADIGQKKQIELADLQEAVCYRDIDQKYWERRY